MKTAKIIQTVSLLLILVIAISCRSSRSSTGGQYPGNPSRQTETSTNTYSVQPNGGNLPPGQAKKIYGSQSAKAYAPGQRKKYPLVIVHTTTIVINRYSDGRYYYRNPAGYMYWKGDDGRYYLDEKHLKDVEYEDGDYDDWKFKGQKNNNAREPKGKYQQEAVKENQKTKDAENSASVKEQKGSEQNQDEKGSGQSEPKVKGNNAKEKDQVDQKAKDNNQKEKDQSGQKAKDNNKKEKDQSDEKVKDDKPTKGQAKTKDKA